MVCQPDLRLPILEGSASRLYNGGQAGSQELGGGVIGKERQGASAGS